MEGETDTRGRRTGDPWSEAAATWKRMTPIVCVVALVVWQFGPRGVPRQRREDSATALRWTAEWGKAVAEAQEFEASVRLHPERVDAHIKRIRTKVLPAVKAARECLGSRAEYSKQMARRVSRWRDLAGRTEEHWEAVAVALTKGDEEGLLREAKAYEAFVKGLSGQ